MNKMKFTENETSAVTALINRLIPGKSDIFVIEKIDSEDDSYYVKKENGKILLGGNCINSVCMALGYFLKHIQNADISWSCINEPLTVDENAEFENHTAHVPQKYRTYMNFCTHSYSCAWWDWERWEKEIDIMALNGINIPLSVTGTEAVWYDTLTELGFTDEEAREYLVGPAFFAWQLMGNIESFSGPLPKACIERNTELGRKIIERQKELGMTPVQQGFTGCVPMMFIDKYKDSNIQVKKHWNNISHTAQLDPTDPLFTEVGRIYMKNMEKLFGLYGFYSADPFHEGTPPVDGSEYLSSVGKITASLMEEADPDYKWVMQAWSLRKDIATAIPKEHLLIFDLAGGGAYSTEGFWGYDFVVGSLHNFGARMNLHGDIKRLADNSFLKIHSEYKNAVGTGLFMEGIGQNPLYYDLALDMLTSDNTADLNKWLRGYTKRRYKTDDKSAYKNICNLTELVYAEGSDKFYNSASIVCARPELNAKHTGPLDSLDETYDNKKLFEVAINYGKTKYPTRGYKYDRYDILRQALSNYSINAYRKTMDAYNSGNEDKFKKSADAFIELLLDIDRLTYQITEWRMQTWIDDARAMADNHADADLYEFNAREQVTIWGNEEKCVLFDYAWKEWSGLISEYYVMRWKKFFGMLSEKRASGKEYSEEGLEIFESRIVWDADEFRKELAKDECAWVHSTDRLPVYEDDDSVFDTLIEKYKNQVM